MSLAMRAGRFGLDDYVTYVMEMLRFLGPGAHVMAVCQPGPACLAAAMRPQGDGTWTFTTNKIPTGSYQVKVSESLSWDVNYGVDGVAGGDNIKFTVATDGEVTFNYDPNTHLLEIVLPE